MNRASTDRPHRWAAWGLSILFLFFPLLRLPGIVQPVFAQGTELEVVALGDSIARGYGCDPGDAYGCLLAEELQTRFAGKGLDVSFQNFGVDGQTSAELLESVGSGTIKDAVSETDILTISIGGNDLLQYLGNTMREVLQIPLDSSTPGRDFLLQLRENGGKELSSLLQSLVHTVQNGDFTAGLEKTAAAFENTMTRLLDFLLGQNPDVLLLLTTIPNPADGTWLGGTVDFLLRGFNERLRDGFGNPQVFVVDTAAAFQAYDGEEALSFTLLDWTRLAEWSVDPHPTPAGHRLMAELHLHTVQDAIDRLVASRLAPRSNPSAVQEAEGGGGRAAWFLPLALLVAAGFGIILLYLGKKARKSKR